MAHRRHHVVVFDAVDHQFAGDALQHRRQDLGLVVVLQEVRSGQRRKRAGKAKARGLVTGGAIGEECRLAGLIALFGETLVDDVFGGERGTTERERQQCEQGFASEHDLCLQQSARQMLRAWRNDPPAGRSRSMTQVKSVMLVSKERRAA
ncbi:MAG: hypothetical protein IPO66_05155 [Rhodanobacteraceae bacterium]|nr:hypothetical protein [Rhodanobacteraceae bacterium]